jgi:integrase/recombinase XerD
MTNFQKFSKEKQYLLGVSPATIEWYEQSLKWLPSENPSQSDLKDVVLRMREANLKPTGINSRARAINSYLHWNSGSDSPRCTPVCKHPKMPRLKEPETILPAFTIEQVKRLVSWKARTKTERRLYLLVLFLLDTGCRISEALSLRVKKIDFDNLLVTLHGKGDKERRVPFSYELRKVMYRYISEFDRKPETLLFVTRSSTQLCRRVMLRDVKQLCRDLGFEPPVRTLHSFRHTFAVHYLRKGGSVFHLQKALGHTSLEMSRNYANLLTEDLQAVHQKVSILGGL